MTVTPCRLDGVKEELRCGLYNVFENRRTLQGRMLPLKIVLVPAHRQQELDLRSEEAGRLLRRWVGFMKLAAFLVAQRPWCSSLLLQ